MALLEIQVVEIEEDVSILIENDNFLFDEQVIQDERLLNLEETSDGIIAELDLIEDELESKCLSCFFLCTCVRAVEFIKLEETKYCSCINVNVHISFKGLQDTTLALNFRVTALEENGGDDGNSSVADLEVRVEILEGTAADHETRISAAELDIDGK